VRVMHDPCSGSQEGNIPFRTELITVQLQWLRAPRSETVRYRVKKGSCEEEGLERFGPSENKMNYIYISHDTLNNFTVK